MPRVGRVKEMSDIGEFARVGTRAALEAGKLLMKHVRTDFAVAHKGDVNLVTEIDIAAEELQIRRFDGTRVADEPREVSPEE